MSKRSRGENGSKRPKDKNAPKRPQSSYFLYSNARRKQLKALHPEKKVTEISKMIAAEWSKMGDADKKPYENDAQTLKAKYENELEDYKGTKNYKEYQEELNKWKAKTGVSSGKTRKRTKDPNAPKKPQSAYFLFINDRRPKLKEVHGDKKVTEISKLLGAEWKDLSPDKKKKWEEKAEALKADYQKQLEAYKKTDNYKKYQDELKKQKKSKKKADESDEESEEESESESSEENTKRKAKAKNSKGKKKPKEESSDEEDDEDDDDEEDD